jgi:hypothetical protein
MAVIRQQEEELKKIEDKRRRKREANRRWLDKKNKEKEEIGLFCFFYLFDLLKIFYLFILS